MESARAAWNRILYDPIWAGCGKTLERELNEKSAIVPRLDMNEGQGS
jgi:hypothetical protein